MLKKQVKKMTKEEKKKSSGVMKMQMKSEIENGGMTYVNAQYFWREPV